jgi:DNA-directed RNA polymerase subunit H (RpoH/RPB5)
MDETSDLDEVDDGVMNIDPDEEEEEVEEDYYDDDEDEEEDEEAVVAAVVDVEGLDEEDEEEEEEDEEEEAQAAEEKSGGSIDPEPAISSSQIFNYSMNAFASYIHKRPRDAIVNTGSFSEVIRTLIRYRGFTTRCSGGSGGSGGWFENSKGQRLVLFGPPKSNISVESQLESEIPEGPLHTLIWVDGNKKKVGVDVARVLKIAQNKYKFTHLLVICEKGLTPKGTQEISGAYLVCNIMLVRELQKCYIHHHLVPFQRALTPEETNKFFQDFKHLTKATMPKILRNDPICKFFGWEIGRIIKSTTILGGALEPQTYYRVVK